MTSENNSTIYLCGWNEDYAIDEKSNNENSDGYPLISPPNKKKLSLSSYSTYCNKTVLISNKNEAQAIGDNSFGQISGSLPRKIINNFTKIELNDSNGIPYNHMSAVCGTCYTLYLVSSTTGKKQLAYSHRDINDLFPKILNTGNSIPIALFGGRSHAIAIDTNGSIIFIPHNIGKSPNVALVITNLPRNDKAVSVACCDKFIVAVGSSGKVFSSRVPPKGDYLSFKEVLELKGIDINSVTGSRYHCIAVSKDGRAFGYGSNLYGRLGLGKCNENISKFTYIKSLSNYKIADAFAGDDHSLFKTSEGKLFACGLNNCGQVVLSGELTENEIYNPIEIANDVSFAIAGFCSTIVFKNSYPRMSPNQRIKNVYTPKQETLNQSDIEKINSENKSQNQNKMLEPHRSYNMEKPNVNLMPKEKETNEQLKNKKNYSDNKIQKSIEKIPNCKNERDEQTNDMQIMLDEKIQNQKKDFEMQMSILKKRSEEQLQNQRKEFEQQMFESNMKLKSQTRESEEKLQSQKKEFDQKLQSQQKELEAKYQNQKKEFDQILQQQKEKFDHQLKRIEESKEKIQKIKDESDKQLHDQIEKLKYQLQRQKEDSKTMQSNLEAEIIKLKKDLSKNQSVSNQEMNILSIDDIQNLIKIGKIGSGASGEVIKVAKNIYALKIMDTRNIDTEHLRQFLNEYEILNIMHHPNIVKTYGIFLSNETTPPSILLEYCPKTLDQFVKEGHMSSPDNIFVLYQIAEGMRYVHFQDVIHRDLKPSNILVSEDGTIKISDFGISRLMTTEEQKTMTRGIGTDKFIAPEIIDNEKYDEKVDVFSFGSVAYFVLSGGSIPDIKFKYLYSNKKIPLPDSITSCAGDLMNSCWNVEPINRPSFESIARELEENGSKFATMSSSESNLLRSKIEQHKSKIAPYNKKS